MYRKNKTIEYFLIYYNDELRIPNTVPQKYSHRIDYQFTVENVDFYCVKSIPYNNPPLIKLKDVQSNGVWICAGDCIQRGITNDINFFGIKISKIHATAILMIDDILCKEENVDEMIVTYHGTHSSNTESILKNNIKESNGMLGTGIYTGSFFKAARFAAWGQNYIIQPGTIFRCLVSKKNLSELKNKCSCCDSYISDHKSLWREYCDGIYVLPVETSEFTRDGSKKYLLRNEEFCTKSVTILSYANLNMKTYSLTYDPNYKEILIL